MEIFLSISLEHFIKHLLFLNSDMFTRVFFLKKSLALIKKKLILIFFVGAMRRKRAGGDGFQPLNTKEENIDVFDVNFNDDEL